MKSVVEPKVSLVETPETPSFEVDQYSRISFVFFWSSDLSLEMNFLVAKEKKSVEDRGWFESILYLKALRLNSFFFFLQIGTGKYFCVMWQ